MKNHASYFETCNVALKGFATFISLCYMQNDWRMSVTYLVLTAVLVAQALSALVQFTHDHFASTEVEGAQVHGVAEITGQLGLTPKFLSCGTVGREKDSGVKEGMQTLQLEDASIT